MENSEFIKIKNLEKIFPVRDKMVRVIKDVNLTLPSGKFYVFFGPSGSGKSTLLNMILGLEAPSSGEITVGNVRLDKQTDETLTSFRKDNIGIITQQPNWIKSSNVISNVAFPLFLRGTPTHKAFNKAMELLNLFEMGSWADFYPTELSFGQQQKIAVARALTTDPNIIVADEPTGNLDYASGVNLIEMLVQLVKKGKTVIMVTHDLNNIEEADTIVRIFDGRVVEILQTSDYSKDELKKKLINYDMFLDQTKSVNPKIEILTTKEGKSKTKKRKFNFKLNLSKETFFNLVDLLKITFFIIVSLTYRTIYSLLSLKFLPSFIKNIRFSIEKYYTLILRESKFIEPNSITPSQLLDIAIRNLFFRKTRAIVTIGGVSIGIAFTVFLLSIGFGIERLIISRVGTLSQLSQIDTYPSSARQVVINNGVIEEFKKIEEVQEVLPVINLAGRVNYGDSNLDAVVFSVQGNFLKYSDFSLLSGEYFNNDELPLISSFEEFYPKVAGEFTGPISAPVVPDFVDGVYQVDVTNEPDKVAVVNLELLRAVGLAPNEAIGKQIDISFLLSKDANNNSIELESKSDLFTIVGVVGNAETPIIYVPIKITESFGEVTYTQARIVSTSQEAIPSLRQKLEAIGYRTTSILDTIVQIESFFSTARIAFLLVGIVGLTVAALGMFNTLTVSLLERTKEVGIMKVIGLKGREVKQLFLSESILIALLGSILGIFLGIFAGFIVSFLISIVSLTRSNEFINISFLPLTTGAVIIFIALIIGLITGFYPALRATKLSPLEALRYE